MTSHSLRCRRRTAIACEFVSEGLDEQFADAWKTCVYRVVQEALTNVARHARAQRVEIRVRRNGALRVEVQDDGIGMDPDAPGQGFGIPGMRERVEALGGVLQLRSRPGRGVALTVELPLSDPPRQA